MCSNEGLCLRRGVLGRALIQMMCRHEQPMIRENVPPAPQPRDSPPHGVVPPPPHASQLSDHELERRQREVVVYLHSSLSSMDVVIKGATETLQMDMS